MAFGTTASHAIAHPGLAPLSHDAAVESWGRNVPEDSGQCGAIAWRCDAHCLFGWATIRLGDDTTAATRELYRDILRFVGSSQFPHLLRIWNYLPRINTGSGDDEHYRRFCVGRAQGFDEFPSAPGALPAGTAIGTHAKDELLVYFIAARQPGHQIENRRQISAFNYPRAYGPRTPMFSRAVVWADERGSCLLVSGTASIVGHASRHPDNLEAQLDETWANLEHLRQQAGATRPITLRVYIRDKADYPATRAFLDKRLDPQVTAIYLLADICRAELLVEIEGVYAMPA